MRNTLDEKKLDWMSILIKMDKDKLSHVDYVFICTVYIADPRYKNRMMDIGQNKGLFRINKETLEIELLIAMEGDENNMCFHRAATKILNEFKDTHDFPKQAHYVCG